MAVEEDLVGVEALVRALLVGEDGHGEDRSQHVLHGPDQPASEFGVCRDDPASLGRLDHILDGGAKRGRNQLHRERERVDHLRVAHEVRKRHVASVNST